MKKTRKKKESNAFKAEGTMNRAFDKAVRLHHPTTVRWIRRFAGFAKGVKLSDETK